MHPCVVPALSVFLAGCITLSWGPLPPEHREFLRVQSQCKDAARAARDRAEGDGDAYKAAYEECMRKRGY